MMLHPPWFSIAAIATIGLTFGVPIFLLHFVELRRRTRELRQREYPAWEGWLARYYPKATPDEAIIIRCLMEGFGRTANVEPTQLRPDDRLDGFVFPPAWLVAISCDGPYEGLYDELTEHMERTGRTFPELASWEHDAHQSWKTVGDVIDFMLERLCPRTNDHAETISK